MADAVQWAAHFGAARIIHAADAAAAPGAEVVLRGSGPWAIRGDDVVEVDADASGRASAQPHDDALLLHVPGHTAGSCALLHAPSRSLFTGDTLALSAGLGRLTLFRRFCWHSREAQRASVEGLLSKDFTSVLPGHGRRAHFACVGAKDAALRHALAEERAEDAAPAR